MLEATLGRPGSRFCDGRHMWASRPAMPAIEILVRRRRGRANSPGREFPDIVDES